MPFWDFLEREKLGEKYESVIGPIDDIRMLEKQSWSYKNFVGFLE